MYVKCQKVLIKKKLGMDTKNNDLKNETETLIFTTEGIEKYGSRYLRIDQIKFVKDSL